MTTWLKSGKKIRFTKSTYTYKRAIDTAVETYNGQTDCQKQKTVDCFAMVVKVVVKSWVLGRFGRGVQCEESVYQAVWLFVVLGDRGFNCILTV
jgi:hypothetical protein